jgi:hypothetical protein
MKLNRLATALVIITLLGTVLPVAAQEAPAAAAETPEKQLRPKDRLVVVWTSADKEVALKMVFMYTYNARRLGWWEDVTLIVWGPSARLAAEDEEIQDGLAKMKEVGVDLKACKACADQLGVSDKLEQLGIEVKYIGKDLTNFIKEGRHVLTF